jgi:hypothetical protein
MLPEYTFTPITMERLTDDMMFDILDDTGYDNFKVETVRHAIYEWLSYSAVWPDVFEQFSKELKNSGGDMLATSPMDAIQCLSSLALAACRYEDSATIRDKLSKEEVRRAMNEIGITGSADDVMTIIADAIVLGIDDAENEDRDFLMAAHITMGDAQRVMEVMSNYK